VRALMFRNETVIYGNHKIFYRNQLDILIQKIFLTQARRVRSLSAYQTKRSILNTRNVSVIGTATSGVTLMVCPNIVTGTAKQNRRENKTNYDYNKKALEMFEKRLLTTLIIK